MKTKTSVLKLAKLGTVSFMMSVGQAAKTTSTVHSNAQIDAEISSMADSVSMALAQSGLGSEASLDSQLQGSIQSHLQNFVSESILNEQASQNNLDGSNQIDLEQKVSLTSSQGKLGVQNLVFVFFEK